MMGGVLMRRAVVAVGVVLAALLVPSVAYAEDAHADDDYAERGVSGETPMYPVIDTDACEVARAAGPLPEPVPKDHPCAPEMEAEAVGICYWIANLWSRGFLGLRTAYWDAQFSCYLAGGQIPVFTSCNIWAAWIGFPSVTSGNDVATGGFCVTRTLLPAATFAGAATTMVSTVFGIDTAGNLYTTGPITRSSTVP